MKKTILICGALIATFIITGINAATLTAATRAQPAMVAQPVVAEPTVIGMTLAECEALRNTPEFSGMSTTCIYYDEAGGYVIEFPANLYGSASDCRNGGGTWVRGNCISGGKRVKASETINTNSIY
ncbi:MAG: hypothetical protein FWG39_01385 [Alphaproteobacteria bacterium]|nr:hypothetical protein [Alphaproteobacteria bacterium]